MKRFIKLISNSGSLDGSRGSQEASDPVQQSSTSSLEAPGSYKVWRVSLLCTPAKLGQFWVLPQLCCCCRGQMTAHMPSTADHQTSSNSARPPQVGIALLHICQTLRVPGAVPLTK